MCAVVGCDAGGFHTSGKREPFELETAVVGIVQTGWPVTIGGMRWPETTRRQRRVWRLRRGYSGRGGSCSEDGLGEVEVDLFVNINRIVRGDDDGSPIVAEKRMRFLGVVEGIEQGRSGHHRQAAVEQVEGLEVLSAVVTIPVDRVHPVAVEAEHPIGMVFAHRGDGLHGIGACFEDVLDSLVDDSGSPDGDVAVEHDHEVCLAGTAFFVIAYRVAERIVQACGVIGEVSGAFDADEAPFTGQVDRLRRVCAQDDSVDAPGFQRVIECVLDDRSAPQTPNAFVRQPFAACPGQNDRQCEHRAWIGDSPART